MNKEAPVFLKRQAAASGYCQYFLKLNNYTQSELAEKVGIATKHQSCIETGRNFPSSELFEKYAIAFDISIIEIFSFNPYVSSKPRREIINNIVNSINMASDYELEIIEKFINILIIK